MSEGMVFKSKIGYELLIPVLITVWGTSFLLMVSNVWVGVALLLITTIWIYFTFFRIRYIIHEDTLEIRALFFKKEIALSSIHKISETRDLWSSPAASTDRLAIYYDKTQRILISPKDKRGFIIQITQRNPEVKIEYTRKR